MSRKHLRNGLAALLAAGLLLLSACAGQKDVPPLADVSFTPSGGMLCAAPEVQDTDNATARLNFHLRALTTLPGLDNRRIMIEDKNGILRQSPDMQWADKPNEGIATAIIAEAVCSDLLRLAGPGRIADSYLLSGRLLAFEVRQDRQPAFILKYRLDLWSRPVTGWIAGRVFESRIPMTAIEPGTLSAASGQALGSTAKEAKDWLESLARILTLT